MVPVKKTGGSRNPIGWVVTAAAAAPWLLPGLRPRLDDIMSVIFATTLSVALLLAGINLLGGDLRTDGVAEGPHEEAGNSTRKIRYTARMMPRGLVKGFGYCGAAMFLSGLVLSQAFSYIRPGHPDIANGRTVPLHQRGSTIYLTESEKVLLNVLIFGGISVAGVVGLFLRRDD